MNQHHQQRVRENVYRKILEAKGTCLKNNKKSGPSDNS